MLLELVKGKKQFYFPSIKATIKDSTGAGDLFASGFIYGLLQNQTLEYCSALGTLVASYVIQDLGAEISEKNWADIEKTIGDHQVWAAK